MWFLGLIVGAIVGAIGGIQGAFFGAVVGLFAGIAMSRKGPVVDETWKNNVEDALRQLHRRVEALEKGGSAAPAATTEAPATPVAEPAPTPAQADVPEAVIAASVASPPAEMPPPSVDQPAPSDDPITRWLFGGNTLVRVGVIVLFFGVAFLLKYAAEHDLVPIELRLAGVAAGGIVLLAFGWRLRLKREGYALVLQGAGVGILYLTVFAGFRLYHLLPGELAFGLLAGIAVFSAALAVLQDSRSLAITGVAGGFLAPVLASTGGGSHVALFSFYAVLNAGILGIAWYKAWRELNLVGFAFTFIIGLSWGSRFYRPELFDSTEPFLVLFFLFYVAIAILFALRRAPELTHYVDGTLVFGTPLVAFGLQTALVRNMEFGSAWSAFALAAFYLVLATVLYSRKRETLRLLVESFLALGVVFATLAIPLAFDGRITSATWAVEGAAIVWIGVRQGRVLARSFGLLLQFAAGFAFLFGADKPFAATPVLNSLYLGCVMVSVAGLFCSRYLESRRDSIGEIELVVGRILFVWGALWWFAGGVLEIHRHAPDEWGFHPYLVFFAGSCAVFAALWRRLDWDMARYAALVILPSMLVVLLAMMDRTYLHPHPFAHHAYLGWALAIAVHLRILREHEGREGSWIDWFHAVGFWLLAVVLSWEAAWQIDHYVEGRKVWPIIAWAIVPGTLIALFAARGERLGWPVTVRRNAYLYLGAMPLAVYLLLWVVFVNFVTDGNPSPLPYVPVISPLDLAQAGALLSVAMWYLGLKRIALSNAPLPGTAVALSILGAVVFVALNGVLLRTLHHYADVPFRFDAMMRSMLVQAAFSLFWSLLALAAMVTATRRALRPLWMVGAVLLAVVVAKLFLIDLANTGTVERVISFISVGVLVIVIGYFAPVPPRAQEKIS